MCGRRTISSRTPSSFGERQLSSMPASSSSMVRCFMFVILLHASANVDASNQHDHGGHGDSGRSRMHKAPGHTRSKQIVSGREGNQGGDAEDFSSRRVPEEPHDGN